MLTVFVGAKFPLKISPLMIFIYLINSSNLTADFSKSLMYSLEVKSWPIVFLKFAYISLNCSFVTFYSASMRSPTCYISAGYFINTFDSKSSKASWSISNGSVFWPYLKSSSSGFAGSLFAYVGLADPTFVWDFYLSF